MILMTAEEGKLWLDSSSITTYRRNELFHAGPKAAYLLSKDSGAKTFLARLLVNEVFAEKSIVMVLEEIDVWPSSSNEFLFAKYREAVTSIPNLSDKAILDYPFHFSEDSEAASMEGLIALCLYMIWEITLFDKAGETVVKISHDEWMEFGSTDINQYHEIVKLFNRFDLDRID